MSLCWETDGLYLAWFQIEVQGQLRYGGSLKTFKNGSSRIRENFHSHLHQGYVVKVGSPRRIIFLPRSVPRTLVAVPELKHYLDVINIYDIYQFQTLDVDRVLQF